MSARGVPANIGLAEQDLRCEHADKRVNCTQPINNPGRECTSKALPKTEDKDAEETQLKMCSLESGLFVTASQLLQ